jgi:hypothetical protein
LAKVSKSAYRTFQGNITVARGFIELHFIIEDLLEHGGKRTIGKLSLFLERTMKLTGISWQKLEKLIEKQVADEIKEKAERIGRAEIERRAKEVVKELTPELENIFMRIMPVATAYERGLLEQALVVTVSALETYLYDITIEAVGKNKFLQKAFISRLQEDFRYSDLVGAHGDITVAVGDVIANSYKFYNFKSVRRHFKTLLRSKTPFDSRSTQEWFLTLLAYRNLIAHNAGIVDKEFKQKTRYKGKVGMPIRLHRGFVSDYIKEAEELVSAIQLRLENLHA